MTVRIKLAAHPAALLAGVGHHLRFAAWFAIGLSCVLGLVVVTLYPIGIW